MRGTVSRTPKPPPGTTVVPALTGAVLLALAGAFPPAAFAGPPSPVSPVGPVEERCPTFSWSAVPGAAGYQVVVHRARQGAAGGPVLSARLPSGATVWTPRGTACLASGERYTWMVRVLEDDGGPPAARPAEDWSEPAAFRVAPAPSPGEVEVALASLRRSLARQGADAPAGGAGTPGAGADAAAPTRVRSAPLRDDGPFRPSGEGGGFADDTGSPTPAAAPSFGSPSLTVDANAALGPAGDVFKDGAVFLWDDTAGNTALGRHALASASGGADGNTALGWEALRYTTEGADATRGSYDTGAGFRALKANTTGSGNTAVGSGALYQSTESDDNTAVGARALFSNTTGSGNTAHGAYALYRNSTGSRNTSSGDLSLVDNTAGSRNTAAGPFALGANTGSGNTAYGVSALQSNTTGARNVAAGYSAGLNATTGDDNVFLLNLGEAGDSGKVRIGRPGFQDGTFIAGIRGTTTGEGATPVVIDAAGQLGTTSSSRSVKQDVRAVGELSRRLLELRPVAFRYRQHVARDPDTPLQYGLVAEEVAEAFPELVAEDRQGRPWSVKYRFLDPLLLNELQRLQRRLAERRLELAGLGERLRALETGPAPQRRLLHGWLRSGPDAAAPRETPE